jgi:hypothetical protein
MLRVDPVTFLYNRSSLPGTHVTSTKESWGRLPFNWTVYREKSLKRVLLLSQRTQRKKILCREKEK